MTLTTELKEIREMLRKIIRDMTRIRESQKQTRDEVYEVRNDLRRFRELWMKEKAEIESRITKVEEEQARRELTRRLAKFERINEAIEMKSSIDENRHRQMLLSESQESQLQKCIESIVKRGQRHGSTVNIEYKKLCSNEKNMMILKDGQRLIRQFFSSRKTDL